MVEIVLLTVLDDDRIAPFAAALGDPVIVRDLEGLWAASGSGRLLVSFSTGVVVPAELIAAFPAGAYNVHAASPDYPGRDPHHFAVYDGALTYGATMHVMTARVDDGPIVDVETFDVPAGITPAALLELANAAALRILKRAGPRLTAGEALPAHEGIAWGAIKRSRKDFLGMCRIAPDISAEEFARRLHAFDGEAYANLFVELHGRRFRIEMPDR